MSRGRRREPAISVSDTGDGGQGQEGQAAEPDTREVGKNIPGQFQFSSPWESVPPPLKLDRGRFGAWSLYRTNCVLVLWPGSCKTQAELIINHQGDTLHSSSCPCVLILVARRFLGSLPTLSWCLIYLTLHQAQHPGSGAA